MNVLSLVSVDNASTKKDVKSSIIQIQNTKETIGNNGEVDKFSNFILPNDTKSNNTLQLQQKTASKSSFLAETMPLESVSEIDMSSINAVSSMTLGDFLDSLKHFMKSMITSQNNQSSELSESTVEQIEDLIKGIEGKIDANNLGGLTVGSVFSESRIKQIVEQLNTLSSNNIFTSMKVIKNIFNSITSENPKLAHNMLHEAQVNTNTENTNIIQNVKINNTLINSKEIKSANNTVIEKQTAENLLVKDLPTNDSTGSDEVLNFNKAEKNVNNIIDAIQKPTINKVEINDKIPDKKTINILKQFSTSANLSSELAANFIDSVSRTEDLKFEELIKHAEKQTLTKQADSQTRPLFNSIVNQFTKFDKTNNRLSIELSPKSLGDLEIDVEIDKDGKIKAIIKAENPLVLDTLKADRHHLLSILKENGFNVDRNSLDFTKKESKGDGGSKNQGNSGNNRNSNTIETDDIYSEAEENNLNVISTSNVDILT